MGWTNIDDEFLIRKKHVKISAKMKGKISPADALLHCVWLWRNSQYEMATQATVIELLDWAEIFDEDLGKEFLEVLCEPRIDLLEKLPCGEYRIRGNKTHLENKKKKSEKAKKMARARWEKEKKAGKTSNNADSNATSMESDATSIAPSMHQAMHEDADSNANTIQDNTTQFNSTQSNECVGKFENSFSEIPDLEFLISDNLSLVLSRTSGEMQKRWLRDYKDPHEVIRALESAVDYHLEAGASIEAIPPKLNGWLRRERTLARKSDFVQPGSVDDFSKYEDPNYLEKAGVANG